MKDSLSEKNSRRPPHGYQDGVLTLLLHVQPGASSTGWSGWHGGQSIKLRVAARAVDDAANQACIKFLARAAGVPRSSVSITRGLRSREKTVKIENVTPERYQALIREWTD
ncbi:MAG: DUF167 domain-containing protein [Deltaproteobacteria bacterium]|nr:DUF167 domain-containing protein [Deltaproteobacteria bacterium]